MSVTTRFEDYTRTGKRKATIQRVLAISTLGLLVLSLATLAMPVPVLGAEPTGSGGDPSSGTSPLDGPEFYVARHGAEPAVCKTWSDALAEFHMVKPLSDPANGAWSPAQAQFFVAQYGTDGALTVFHEENDQAFLCQA